VKRSCVVAWRYLPKEGGRGGSERLDVSCQYGQSRGLTLSRSPAEGSWEGFWVGAEGEEGE
jgi:hypothetical protein